MRSPNPILIAPSILASDFARLGEEIRAVELAGADVIHVDVMDGHFVPNLTIGLPVVRAIRGVTRSVIDAHLMITNADHYVTRYVEAGCDWVSVHVEAVTHLQRVLQEIREAGAEPGVVLNPHTHEDAVDYVLEDCHHVLVMSVNPGFGGQRFLSSQLRKIERLRERAVARGLTLRIEVDGGVDPDTAPLVRAAGADVLVAGSAVFGAADYATAIAALRG